MDPTRPVNHQRWVCKRNEMPLSPGRGGCVWADFKEEGGERDWNWGKELWGLQEGGEAPAAFSFWDVSPIALPAGPL